MENRGDVTVNAVLQLGSLTETVTVSESPVAVKFNITTMELTMDTRTKRRLRGSAPTQGRELQYNIRLHF